MISPSAFGKVLLFCAFFLLAGCGKRSSNSRDSTERIPVRSIPEMSPPPPAPPAAPAETSQRMIARDGSVRIAVEDQQAAAASIRKLVKEAGGYIAQESMERYANLPSEITMDVKIPYGTFDSSLAAITRIADVVLSQRISQIDYTEAYTRDTTELSTKRAELEGLTQLLRSAKSIQDIMAIKKELIDVQSDLDSYSASAKSTEHRVAFASLNLTIAAKASQGFLAKIGQAFLSGFSTFSDVLAGTITFLIGGIPAFIVIGILIYLIRKLLHRRRARRDSATG
jgi:hypothetical protein